MKKVISIFVAIAMLTTIFSVMIPGAVFAADNTYDQNNSITLAASTMQLEVGKVTGDVNSTVEIPIYFTGVPATGILNTDFLLKYDPSILEVTKIESGNIIVNSRAFDTGIDKQDGILAFLFSEESGDGLESIFEDGVFAVITATVKSKTSAPITLEKMGALADNNFAKVQSTFVAGGVNVGGGTPTTRPSGVPGQTTIEVASVEAAAGATVQIPIYFTGVPSKGILNTDFLLKYDPSILEVTSIESGDIIVNSRAFDTGIDKQDGILAFLFSEESGDGIESIFNDGVFAIITATVKSKTPAPITLEKMGALADNDFGKIQSTFIAGGVNVGGQVSTPTPTPTIRPTSIPGQMTIEVAKVEAAAGATVEIPIYFTGVPSKGILNTDFLLKYNPSILEVTSIESGNIIVNSRAFDTGIDKEDGILAFLFSEESGDGIESIFEDGVFAVIRATVKSKTPAPITLEKMGALADNDFGKIQSTFIAGGVNVGGQVSTPTPTPTIRPTSIPGQMTIEVAKVEAAAGATVEIPIYFTGVPSKGVLNTDFLLKYNPSILEVTSIESGNIIVNSRAFDTGIDKEDGILAFLFSEESGDGIESIFNDGVFAIIRATVKSKTPAPITLEKMGALVDNDFIKIQSTFIAGGVNVGDQVFTPTPTQPKTATPTPTRPSTSTPTPRPAGDLKVEFYNSNPSDTSNSISPQFKVINGGSSAVDLSKLTLRYYYTIDGDKDQTFWCDHAAVLGSDGSYNGVTANVKGTFVKMSSKTSDADTYLEISFSGGTLPAGANLQIQGRFAKNDWTNYTQSNDYSFRSGTSQFAPWDKVTAYLSGSLVWGSEPGGSKPTSTPTPTRPTSTPTPTRRPTDPPSGDALEVVIGKVTGTVGQEVRIPITFKEVPKDGIVNCDFSLIYDSSVLNVTDVEYGDVIVNDRSFETSIEDGAIVFLFSEESGDGIESIFNDGVFATIVATIKSGSGLSVIELERVGAFADNNFKRIPTQFTSGGVQVIGDDATIFEIAKVSGKVGEQIDITITLSGVPKDGIVNCDFALNYDASVLKINDIVPGDVIVNDRSFDMGIFEEEGLITLLFSEESGDGIESIFDDGTFVIIKATIIGGNDFSPITLEKFGACADNNFKKIPALVVDGGVTVDEGTVPTSTRPTSTPTPTKPTPTQTGGETPNPGELLVKIGKASGKIGEDVAIPIEFLGVPENGIVNCDFLLNYDPSVLKVNSIEYGDIVVNSRSFDTTIAQDEGYLVFLFSEESGDGIESIFNDGVFAVINATIIGGDGFSPVELGEFGACADNDFKKINVRVVDGGVTVGEEVSPTPTIDPTPTPTKPTPTDPVPTGGEVLVKVEKVSGQPGKTVIIPVKLIGIPEKGLVNCDFTLEYDPDVLEIVSIESGEIVQNPRSFEASILADEKQMVFLFSEDSGDGDEAIVSDGVLARINATIKSDAAEGLSPIKVIKLGGFADYYLKKVEASGVDGGVEVKVGGEAMKVSGYIVPDFEVAEIAKPIVNAGFKVEIVGTDLYGVTDANGYFEIADVPESATGYTLKITKDTYLTREIANVIVTDDVQLGQIEMWAGDIVQDNAINMKDIVEIIKSFNTIEGNPKYDEKADINKNKAINMEDMVIVIKHFLAIPADYDIE